MSNPPRKLSKHKKRENTKLDPLPQSLALPAYQIPQQMMIPTIAPSALPTMVPMMTWMPIQSYSFQQFLMNPPSMKKDGGDSDSQDSDISKDHSKSMTLSRTSKINSKSMSGKSRNQSRSNFSKKQSNDYNSHAATKIQRLYRGYTVRKQFISLDLNPIVKVNDPVRYICAQLIDDGIRVFYI